MIDIVRTPTIEAIRDGGLIEGPSCDFKGRLELDESRSKTNFINDVVAFLNSGAGHLMIGVHEKRGAFHAFEPLKGSKDEYGRRLLSVIQDNIDPKPLRVTVHFLEVDDGFIADVNIPAHLLRPYQNKITGGFYLRTGAQNTPLTREQVRAMFVSTDKVEADVLQLMRREDDALKIRNTLSDAATLHIAIVPYQHYQRDFEPFDPGLHILKMFRYFHYEKSGIFKGCDRGFEALNSTNERIFSRFFIGDDWLIHSYVAYPFTIDQSGRLTLHEFEDLFSRHLRDIQLILSDSKVEGPYCVLAAVRNLRSAKLAWAFPNAGEAALGRPTLVERLDDKLLSERFFKKIRSVSVYGA